MFEEKELLKMSIVISICALLISGFFGAFSFFKNNNSSANIVAKTTNTDNRTNYDDNVHFIIDRQFATNIVDSLFPVFTIVLTVLEVIILKFICDFFPMQFYFLDQGTESWMKKFMKITIVDLTFIVIHSFAIVIVAGMNKLSHKNKKYLNIMKQICQNWFSTFGICWYLTILVLLPIIMFLLRKQDADYAHSIIKIYKENINSEINDDGDDSESESKKLNIIVSEEKNKNKKNKNKKNKNKKNENENIEESNKKENEEEEIKKINEENNKQ